MSDEIIKLDKEEKKPFRPGAKPLVGLAARKAALEKEAAEASASSDPRLTPELPPEKMPDRIGIVFDDSGSMSGPAIKDAHDGVEEFLRSCKPTTTAVAVYSMNDHELRLCTTLPTLAQLVRNIPATGGTPAVETLDKMLHAENLTRAIMFSDGSFSMANWEPRTLPLCKEQQMVVDTVFIGPEGSYAIQNMKKIAEDTGGIFLHFIPGKAAFSRAFKYLSPGNRLQLMDKSFKEKVERGEV